MAFHNTIRTLLPTDTNHADNFNEVYGQLLENDLSLLGSFSNPNLLIGADFLTNPWQRGTVFTPSSGYNYTADRWVLSQGVLNGAKVEKVTSGLKLSCLTSSAGSYARIEQRGEKNAYLRNYFNNNKDIAISTKINGTIYSGVINTASSNSGVIYAVGSLFNGSFGFGISTQSTTNYDYRVVIDNYNSAVPLEIEWVKLELGSVVTLFVPRHYGEESGLCKRYYEVLGLGEWFEAYSANAGYVALKFSTEKRVVPTITVGSSCQFWGMYAHANVSLTNVVSNEHSATTKGIAYLRLSGTASANLVAGAMYGIGTDCIIADAEL